MAEERPLQETPKEPESVSEAVRRTLARLADIQVLEERVRKSEIALPPKKPIEPPKSSRGSMLNATPVGVACAPAVASVFERGGLDAQGLLNTPVIVDRRLKPANTEFFYNPELWAARRKEQEIWDATHAPQPPGEAPR